MSISKQPQKGFEYIAVDANEKTIFEIFLEYTDEKEKSSAALASILSKIPLPAVDILDIGGGNGEYISLAIGKSTGERHFAVTLVEPSEDLAQRAGRSDLGARGRITVVQQHFDTYTTDQKFDVVLVSHVFYHFRRETWPKQLQKMASLLKPGGKLIIVSRERDDIYTFKNRFRTYSQPPYRASSIEDILEVMQSSPTFQDFAITRRVTDSRLVLNPTTTPNDAHAIIEFYLHMPWRSLPEQMQKDILQFLKEHNYSLRQRDGFIIAAAPAR